MTGPRAPAPLVAATVATVLATACGGSQSPEASALADAVRGAQTAELNVEVVPAGYHGPGSSAELIQPALDHVQTELAKYYVGSLLARKVTQHQDAIRGMAQVGAGGRIGGVRALDLKDVQVSGATAKVRAEVTVWFKTAQVWDQSVSSKTVAAGRSIRRTRSSRQVEGPDAGSALDVRPQSRITVGHHPFVVAGERTPGQRRDQVENWVGRRDVPIVDGFDG